MKDLIPLKAFVRLLQPVYPPITYKKALEWAHAGQLPVWPRVGNEHFIVKLDGVRAFCRRIGLQDETIRALLSELQSNG